MYSNDNANAQTLYQNVFTYSLSGASLWIQENRPLV